MRNILQRFLLSCHRASKLIEKSQLGPISYKEDLQLKIHKLICGSCQNYEKQSLFIGKILENHYNHEDEQYYPEIDLKALIKEKLRQKQEWHA